MQNLKNAFLKWLPLAVTIVVLSGMSFVGIQQIHRSTMNDPQISIVSDAVSKLEQGLEPVEVVGRGPNINSKIDLENSLSPFIGVYDKDGTPLETNAKLGSNPPRPPVGIFEYAQTNGMHKVTWQPNSKTRVALVVMPVNNGKGWFVASGRNMSEDEKLIGKIFKLFVCCTLFALVITFALEMISGSLGKK